MSARHLLLALAGAFLALPAFAASGESPRNIS